MFDSTATAWPDQLQNPDRIHLKEWSWQDFARAIRIGQTTRHLEAALLSRIPLLSENKDIDTAYILLCWFYFTNFERRPFDALVDVLRLRSPDRLEVRVLTILRWLWFDDVSAINVAPSGIWRGISGSRLLQLCKVFSEVKVGSLEKAEELLSHYQLGDCLEGVMLQAKILSRLGRVDQALLLLKPMQSRLPNHLRYHKQLLQHMLDGLDGENVIAMARHTISRFGEHSELLFHVTTINLYRRYPGLARRSSLMQAVWATIKTVPISIGNQFNAYEANGQCDWLEHLSSDVTTSDPRLDGQLHSNLSLQLASICSPLYSEQLSSLVRKLLAMPEYKVFRSAGKGVPVASAHRPPRPLRVGWITGDLTYHPVTRFLYGIFAGSLQCTTSEHCLISMVDHGSESAAQWFEGLSNITVFDASKHINEQRVAVVRDLSLDLVVDLSGWTGGNYVAGFLARLAPVQVNYLGYFASSGLPTMDYWLGDDALFPSDCSEWATERLWRLSRPFLAWNPLPPLQEASVDVPEAEPGPIRFGSFNHTRKLSDQTLRLWSELLESIPQSRLVLKAAAGADSDTQRLLRRRMERQGLNPERVDWLPLTKGSQEHMLQYAHIDIALDPIPNGGCTTTCEALWLGVPTITMSGDHYVSRMSTAVLLGAGMPEWIASDRAGYIALAREHATRLQELRQSREHWRQRLQASPLGDAAGMMQHLEAAFSAMHSEVLSMVEPPGSIPHSTSQAQG